MGNTVSRDIGVSPDSLYIDANIAHAAPKHHDLPVKTVLAVHG